MRKFLALLTAVLLLSAAACADGDDSSSAPATSETDAPVSTSAPVSTTASSAQTTSEAATSAPPATSASAASTTTEKIATVTTTATKPPVAYEKPVTINTAVLFNKKTSSYDAQAESRRQKILNLPDTLAAEKGGKTYYVSYRGDDANSGLTKATPKKSHRFINEGLVKENDVVLFERGGVYRDISVLVPNGVSLGAYGTGPKPQLLGSDKNFADKNAWKETATENIWTTSLVKSIGGAQTSAKPDVGNIVFDHGKKVASAGKKLSLKAVKAAYDFYYDSAKNLLYLYHDGNPAEQYSSIEISSTDAFVRLEGKNHVLENLCVKYTGGHAISSGASENITVRGCEVGYIGGIMHTGTVRLGNGIEFYTTCKNNLVEYNWVYQCYDAGYSNQGDGWHDNITVRGNLIEYCPSNIEIFTVKEVGKGGLRHCTYEDNILRFAGFGFGTYGRMGSTSRYFANMSLYDWVVPCEDTVMTNNVFDCSYRYLTSIGYPNDSQKRGPTITGNTWIQRPFSEFYIIQTEAAVGKSMLTEREYLVRTEADLVEGVHAYDTAPKQIIFEPAN